MDLKSAKNPALREQARQQLLNQGTAPAAAVAKGGTGKLLAKGALGIGAIVALVMGLDKVAHPTLPNTTPDNEYGLTPTQVCDQYGQPIIKDFRGILWSKSTLSRLDMKNLPPLHMCTEAELADAAPAGGADGAAPMQKRDLEKKEVSRALSK